ncbi:uncharacterized protein [Nicotiana tomentosiformis]|uniref:uncharacterized protein n=1 Tax=Nicotiana tomentosiformis TaxID=4098 RepID=UPI00388C7F14
MQKDHWIEVRDKSTSRSGQNTSKNGNLAVTNAFSSLGLPSTQHQSQVDEGTGGARGQFYGLHSVAARRPLWDALASIARIQHEAWVTMGDYNTIRHYDDRIKGNPVQEYEVADFKRFMVDTNMVELKTTGRRYKWTNNHVLSKIDWALVNSEWMTTWTHVEATTLDPYFSYHNPIAIEIGGRGFKGARPFRFFNHLAQHPYFLLLVKHKLNALNCREFSKATKKVEYYRKKLAEIQHEARDPQKQVELAEKEKELKQQLEKLNTIDGNIAQTEKEVEIEVIKYQNLLGSAADILPTVQLDVLDEGHKLTRDQQLKLIEPISREEVYNAVEDIYEQKAPGCDGFNSHFFKKSWQVVGEEIISAVMDFFHTGNMFKPINCTSVTLVPKIINEIVATCRKFLWSGGANESNKALIAWETLCYPKAAGGVNFIDVELWNKAAICK